MDPIEAAAKIITRYTVDTVALVNGTPGPIRGAHEVARAVVAAYLEARIEQGRRDGSESWLPYHLKHLLAELGEQ